MSTHATVPAARGRPPGRTRDDVIDAATALVESEGFDALSMPRLAKALGVGTMTLYGYVADKEDLINAVIERLLDGWPEASVADDRPWDERVVAYLVAIRRVLIKRPELARVGLHRPLLTRANPHRFADELAVLRTAGFDAVEAVALHRALNAHLFGNVLLHLNRDPQSKAQRRATVTRLAELAADRDTVVRAVLETEDEAGYAAGVRLILAGAVSTAVGR